MVHEQQMSFKVDLNTVALTQHGQPYPGTGRFRFDPEIQNLPEMQARDRHAPFYLGFPKHKIQTYRVLQFLAKRQGNGRLALDLGCGPGPTTELLLSAGYSVAAIDFSLESLRINDENCSSDNVLFIHANLNEICLRPNSVDGVMISDVLQHLGDAATQTAFLRKAIQALRLGGWFYLSFFNVNLKNRLKADIQGAFSNGAIPYRRQTIRQVIAMLPIDARVASIIPMNIFDSTWPDRIASALPLAPYLSRMILVHGTRQP